MWNEITKLHININKIEDTKMLCNNTAIAIRTDRGLHILDIPYNLQRYDKNLDYVETIITASKYSPVSVLFENNFMKGGVRNSEFIQMVLDPTLWPHNNHLLNEMTSIVAFEWSPTGLIDGMESVMAVLTNVGCVELYGPSRLEWISVLNISSLVKDNLKDLSLAKVNVTPKNSKELQEIAHSLATVAICWSDKKYMNGSCYFVTAQKNGLILFWSINSRNSKLNAKVIGHLNEDIIEVNIIKWIPIKNLILLYSKNRHLVVQIFDKHFNLITQDVKNLTDYKVTDIKRLKNEFYLSTINNKFYKIDIECINTNFKVQTTLVDIKESYPSSELHAIGFSPNGVLCTFALIERKVLWRKEPLKIDLIIMKKSNENSEMLALYNNQEKKLTNYWDYIEVLIYMTLKTGMLPEFDYANLLSEGETDIYKLKVYYIMLTLYNNLEKLCKVPTTISLPETSLEVISERIHALHASDIMKKNYKKHNANCISKLELETLSGAKAYLEYYCEKYKTDLSNFVDPQITSITTDYKYICQCCDKEINGFSCTDGHLNMFCSITFTPIDNDDYLFCKGCGALAHLQLLPEKPTCVFCDLYLYEFVTT
ncbi:uncharacterized protein LOC123722215 [Papilio machaon]|uniref:uncharacterized protein LOC123722215 n=1 Tax=Papilio machaon TaxID=76193 RepID=UPI001E665049|nr:uncharacterized protein LOC123722215 [Papilio machaon]